MPRGRIVAIGVLVVLALAAAPLLGRWVLGVAALLLVVLVAAPRLDGVATSAALVLGVRGGVVGGASALAALALALIAAAGGALAPTRPKLAGALPVGGSTLGFVAINLFSINTFYFVALPACWLAAALALARPAPDRAGPG